MVLGLGLLAVICLTWTPFALVLGPVLPQPLGKRVGRRAIQVAFRTYVILLQLLCGCRFDLKALDELARRSGVSRASLSRIENGEVSPSAVSVRRI